MKTLLSTLQAKIMLKRTIIPPLTTKKVVAHVPGTAKEDERGPGMATDG